MTSPDLASLSEAACSNTPSHFDIIPHSETHTELSFAQQRQWVIWKLAPESNAYHIPVAIRLKGNVDRSFIEVSLNYVLQKHPALRTQFEEGPNGVHQTAVSSQLCVTHHNLSTLAGQSQEDALAQLRHTTVNTPFDLYHAPLLRVVLIDLGASQHELIVVMHHIVSDGWSMQLIIDDFMQSYIRLSEGETLPQPTPSLGYSDYARAHKAWLKAGELDKQLAYWRGQLGEEQTILSLPEDLEYEAVGTYTGAIQTLTLDVQLGKQLKAVAHSVEGTLSHVLMAAWQMTLRRLTGEQAIRVGMPVANRTHPDAQDIVGFFVNTLVIGQSISSEQRLLDVVQNTKTVMNEAQQNQDLPFEKLIEALNIARDTGAPPLFQVMMNHQKVTQTNMPNLPGIDMADVALPRTEQEYKLILNVLEYDNDTIELNLCYANQCFSATRNTLMLDALTQCLQDIAQKGHQSVGALFEDGVLGASHWQLRDTQFAVPEFTPICHVIDDMAQRFAPRPALVVSGHQVSYAQLATYTNQLANCLLSKRVIVG
jgi:NRPS condensation-like uncharacterized protein